MNKSVIYIVGATVLLGGGAYLFLKNKKAKDLAELEKLGGTTTGGTTTGGTTSGGTTTGGTTTGGTKPPLSTTSDGVSPSDANLNLANATVLVGTRAMLQATANQRCVHVANYGFGGWGKTLNDPNYDSCSSSQYLAKKQLPEIDKQLAKLGYKIDATGQLVKI